MFGNSWLGETFGRATSMAASYLSISDGLWGGLCLLGDPSLKKTGWSPPFFNDIPLHLVDVFPQDGHLTFLDVLPLRLVGVSLHGH